MIWFNGSIADAVQTSKTKNAIFVVYVEGQDENSKQMTAMINHPEAITKLGSSNFIAVKLDAGSESYNQFVQIYQLVPVPSLFFIGKNGTPIEVIPQRLEHNDFLAKIDSIVVKSGYKNLSTAQKTANLIRNEIGESARTSPPENSVKVESSRSAVPTATEVTETSATNQQNDKLDDTNEKSLTTDERVERARQIIETKRELKQHEEEEEERKKEMERRKMGQDVQKMRRQQQEEELKHMREEILREKQEQMAVRQKILTQIEQDKEERAKKFSQPIQEPATAQPTTKPPEINTRDVTMCGLRARAVARLQFRLADGTSNTHDFPSSSTLESVRDYVRNNLNLPYRNFDLSTTFPRRQFTNEDNSRTLVDLELVPNAVILVVPIANTTIIQAPPGSGVISVVFWFLVSPFVGIFNYVRNFLGNRRSSEPTPPPTVTQPAEPNPTSSSNGPSMPKRRIPPDSTVIRREGNIHRLADRRDESDDENNTWNGNSTQQM